LGFGIFASVASAQTIVAPRDSSQFHSVPATSGTYYVLRDTGTYYVAPGSWRFNNMTFSNSGADAVNEAAVYVQGNGAADLGSAVFRGSNLAILGTGTSGNSRRAMVVFSGADAFLTDSVIRQEKSNAATGNTYALYCAADSRFTGAGLLIEAAGPQVNAVYIANSRNSRLVLDSSLIRNSGSAAALRLEGGAVVLLASTTIAATGAVAPGFQAGGSRSYLILDGGLIHAAGAGSPGLWLGSGNTTSVYGNGIMEFTAVFQNALVRADDGMGVEINTDLPGLISRPAITGMTPYMRGYYDLTLVSSTLSGAHGAFRMTSSSTSGAAVAEIPTLARVSLAGSALGGDVFVNDGAQFILNGTASRLDGALRLSGSAPAAAVTLAAGSAITGGIVLSGGAALDLSADASVITGTLAAAGHSSAKVRLTGGSTLGAIALDDFAALELTMDNTSAILGDFSIRGGATYTLLPADNASLVFSKPLTLATGGNLRVAPGANLTLTSPLTFADPAATVTLADARGDDLVLAAGLAGKGRLIVQGIHAGALGQPEIRVVRDDTRALAPDAFLLAAPAANRLFAWHGLENRPDGAYLTRGGFSSVGAAILDTPALAAADFFDALPPVFRHLDGLRENDALDALPRQAGGDAGALWLSTRSGATTAGGARPGLAFDQQTFALAAGADLRWGGRPDLPALTAGLFADTARSAKDFAGDADGRATTFGGGLYALYQRPGAWHASATVRIEEAGHAFDVRDTGLSADYSARSAGAALQFGWFLPGLSPAGWWAEPSVEAGVARIGGATYDTRSADAANRFRVSQGSATAAHARAQITLGRDFAEKWGFRARFAVSHLGISGGDISCDDVEGANYLLDGFRAEGTLGLVRRLGPGGRLWLDCGTAHAAHYKRSYAISLGFGKAW
jgi:hypothetical protein